MVLQIQQSSCSLPNQVTQWECRMLGHCSGGDGVYHWIVQRMGTGPITPDGSTRGSVGSEIVVQLHGGSDKIQLSAVERKDVIRERRRTVGIGGSDCCHTRPDQVEATSLFGAVLGVMSSFESRRHRSSRPRVSIATNKEVVFHNTRNPLRIRTSA